MCFPFIRGQSAPVPLQDVASLGILAEKLEGDKAVLERQLAEAREAQVTWLAIVHPRVMPGSSALEMLERQLAEAREAQVRWLAIGSSSCYAWIQCTGNAGAPAGSGAQGAGEMVACNTGLIRCCCRAVLCCASLIPSWANAFLPSPAAASEFRLHSCPGLHWPHVHCCRRSCAWPASSPWPPLCLYRHYTDIPPFLPLCRRSSAWPASNSLLPTRPSSTSKSRRMRSC